MTQLKADQDSAAKMMIKEMKSPFDYAKTVSTLVDRINSAKGWSVVAVYDMNESIVKNGGNPVGKFSVIKYCNGKYASEMLMDDSRKMMGAMMPKAFAVYEKADGQVYLATLNGAVMGKLLGGEVEKIIDKVAVEVHEILSFMNF